MIAALRPLVLATVVALPGFAFAQAAADADRLAAACNRFAADLQRELAARGAPVFSPASLSIALLMLLPGARGTTAAEIATMLHLPEDLRDQRLHAAAHELLTSSGVLAGAGAPGSSSLQITNDLWVQQGFALVPAYVEVCKQSFGAGATAVDFGGNCERARQTINAHVAKATHDRIRELVPKDVLGADTRLVLTNSLWFKAAWQHPFPASATRPAPFAVAADRRVEVPMMRHIGDYAYAENDAWQCVSLPFAKESIVCDVVLPREGKPLADAEQALLAGTHVATLASAKVAVEMPRFKVAATHRLDETLEALGMRAAFGKGAVADFSGLAAESLEVTAVLHQTWIAVDEFGAEATAATAIPLGKSAAARPAEWKTFRCDRPFGFVLRDARTGLVLFAGRVDDPTRDS